MTEPQVPLSATGSSLRRLHRYLFPLKGLKHLPRIPGLRVRQPLIMPSAEKTGPRRLSAVNRLHGTRSSKRDYAHPACLSSRGGGGGAWGIYSICGYPCVSRNSALRYRENPHFQQLRKVIPLVSSVSSAARFPQTLKLSLAAFYRSAPKMCFFHRGADFTDRY